MIVLDNGDSLRGIAEVATQLDFIVNGYVGVVATQLSDGQMASTEANLYLSGADATVVTSITVVNTDSVARTFTLYLKPSGGTSRAISPVSLDLPAGYSFYTDGQRTVVMNTEGQVVATAVAAAHALGGASHTADTLSNLNSKISDATLVDTASIVLKALFDANTILAATSDNTPAALTVAASRILGRKASGNIAAMTVAELLTLINVAAGATIDQTGDEIVALLEALVGAAQLSHTKISDLGATDHHTAAILQSLLTTRGDIIFRNTTVPARLAKGSSGDVLTMGADDPAWSAPAGAGATLTVAETNVFSGTSPQTWTDLNLSGVVGSNVALVLLKFDSTSSSILALAVRKDGDTDEFYQNTSEPAGIALGKNTQGIHIVFLVATNSSGVIEWICQTARTGTTVDIIAYIK